MSTGDVNEPMELDGVIVIDDDDDDDNDDFGPTKALPKAVEAPPRAAKPPPKAANAVRTATNAASRGHRPTRIEKTKKSTPRSRTLTPTVANTLKAASRMSTPRNEISQPKTQQTG